MLRRIPLTVDVEPDWAVGGTRALHEVAPRFLDLLENRSWRATFFVVGGLAAIAPDLIREMGRRHEVASHGLTHRPLDALGAEEAWQELVASKARLQEVGCVIRGFRAPFFRRRHNHWRLVAQAGYEYDASLGSVFPGPINARLSRLPCPLRLGNLHEFPTSAMATGMFPLSLTWLRLLAPLSISMLPKTASLFYLHLHEFLPPQTARGLPLPLRVPLTRNCGQKAWDLLERALDALDVDFVACADVLDSRQTERGS